MKNKHILIIEDDRILAENTVSILKNEGYINCIIVDNINDAQHFTSNHDVYLILSDIRLHNEISGPTIIKNLQEQFNFEVIYLTAYTEDQYLKEVNQTYFHSYLTKPFTKKQLLVSVALATEKYLAKNDKDVILKPTKKELEIINNLSKGYSSKQIALELKISEYTIKTHRRNILKKYNLSSSSELVAFAIKNGWVINN